MTPVELDSAQRWAARLEPGAEIRTTIGPNGRTWTVVDVTATGNLIHVKRTPGQRIQYKSLHGDALIAAHRATRYLANRVAAPQRLRYTT